MRRFGRRVVRRERCPTCGEEVAITRAELRAGVAHCACGVDLAIAVHATGDGPTRSSPVIDPRPMLGAPPTPRIVEKLRGEPTLELYPSDDAPLATLDTLRWRLARLFRGPLRLRVVGGALEVRGRWTRRSLPLAALAPGDLPLDGLDLDGRDRAWILGWIREQSRR